MSKVKGSSKPSSDEMDQSSALTKSEDVEFQDVYYTVNTKKNFVKTIAKCEILKGVSGVFRSGELSAIMGPSGAGKSSLLNAISGYRTSGVSGHININRNNSCYIVQEDEHQKLLNVEELMNLACDLKLKKCINQNATVTEILKNLNLNHCRKLTAEQLSGGERKRLSIALELVANPKIFFLDEPTSGLDEVTAAQCIRLLREMAHQGRTIVCTIHQPSATIFNCFDNVYVLAKGECVYQGKPKAIIPFLRQVNLKCPKYYSPSDYIIEICDSDDASLISSLSELTHNGKLMYVPSTLNPMPINNTSNINSYDNNYNIHTSMEFKSAITSMFLDQSKQEGFYFFDRANPLVATMKAFSKKITNERQQVSSFRQFCVLLNIMLIKMMRSRIALAIQITHHIMCGIFFGLVFYNSANQGERMFDHLKFCVGCILVIVYTQVMVPILSYPMEVKLVKKEFFNRWYSLTPYYMALTLSRIPLQVIFNLMFLSITYYMAGLPLQLWRFSLFALVGIMTSFVAEGMGLAIGASFNLINGTAVGPMLIAPLMGLAIYGFDFASEISTIMNGVMKCSYIRVGSIGIVLTVFGFNRERLHCNDIYCHFDDPKVLLRFLQIDKTSLWSEFGYLLLLLFFFRAILFISLKRRCGT